MLKNIKKGDMVVRKSHNRDVIFVVDRIIKNQIVILTGVTTRLKADSYIEDLEIIDKTKVQKAFAEIDEKINKHTDNTEIIKNSLFKRSNKIIYTGKILHLDGDTHYCNPKTKKVIFNHNLNSKEL